MSKKVVTLGEIMMRLSTPDFKRFVQSDTFDVTYGGGEANVAAALCNYGLNGTFVSKVPDTAIGQAAINHLRRYGVETKYVARGGERLGIYFLETGASMRASQVVYDRANASISDVDASDVLTYDVYFGTVNPPTVKVAENKTTPTYEATSLQAATQYYWRVVVKDNKGGATTGQVWNFRTN